MLFFMHYRSKILRTAIAIIAVLAIVIAAPVHAAHHHGNASDPGHMHTPCAICQLHSPACHPVWVPCPGIPLEPIFVLAAVASPAPIAVPAVVDACRAPPSFVA